MGPATRRALDGRRAALRQAPLVELDPRQRRQIVAPDGGRGRRTGKQHEVDRHRHTIGSPMTVRVTARWLNRWSFTYHRDCFPQGTVLRVWIGRLFIKMRWPIQ
jgi:hypothetical protein